MSDRSFVGTVVLTIITVDMGSLYIYTYEIYCLPVVVRPSAVVTSSKRHLKHLAVQRDRIFSNCPTPANSWQAQGSKYNLYLKHSLIFVYRTVNCILEQCIRVQCLCVVCVLFCCVCAVVELGEVLFR